MDPQTSLFSRSDNVAKNVGKSSEKVVVKEVIVGDKQSCEALAKASEFKTLDEAHKKALREEEDSGKASILLKEEENHSRIYALKCSNGWLKIFDNSALILSSWLDGKLGRSYKRNDDKGFGQRAKYGVVSIPPDGVLEFVTRLFRAGISLISDELYYLEFELGERVSHEDMVRLLHEDQLLIDKTNQLVMPKEVFPNLRAEVKKMLDYIHSVVRDQRDSTKEVFMNDVERAVIRMNKDIIMTARGRMSVDTCLATGREFVDEMYANATTMSDLGLLTAKQYKTLVDTIVRTRGELDREVKRRAIAKSEAATRK